MRRALFVVASIFFVGVLIVSVGNGLFGNHKGIPGALSFIGTIVSAIGLGKCLNVLLFESRSDI